MLTSYISITFFTDIKKTLQSLNLTLNYYVFIEMLSSGIYYLYGINDIFNTNTILLGFAVSDRYCFFSLL